MANTPRGVANFNPLNLRKSAVRWLGQADDQTDADFVQFTSATFGIRAGCRNLLTYGARGAHTITQVISTWAPGVENDTAAYIASVAKMTGFGADDEIGVDSVAVMLPLLKAMITVECGQQPYSDTIINDAMRMAGVADALPKPLVKSKPAIAQIATLVTGAGTVIDQAVQEINSANETVTQVDGAGRTAGQAVSTLGHWVHLLHSHATWPLVAGVVIVVAALLGIHAYVKEQTKGSA